MRISRILRGHTPAILLMAACLVVFALIGYYFLSVFPATSYRVITIFIILIILSNIYAKICIHIINNGNRKKKYEQR